jgi:hypothetical protein
MMIGLRIGPFAVSLRGLQGQQVLWEIRLPVLAFLAFLVTSRHARRGKPSLEKQSIMGAVTELQTSYNVGACALRPERSLPNNGLLQPTSRPLTPFSILHSLI